MTQRERGFLSSRRPDDRGPLVASFTGSLRLLRVTWMLWIASFLWLFAFPLLLVFLLPSRTVDAEYLVACGDPALVDRSDPWLGFPYGGDVVWPLVVLTVLLPPAVHWLLVRRVDSPFVVRRAAESVAHDYRSPPPWAVATSPRVVRRLVALYAGRMGLALAASFVTLLHTAFNPVVSFCHVCNRCEARFPLEQMVPDCLFFATVLFAVALYHVPVTSRVLGRPPKLPRGRG